MPEQNNLKQRLRDKWLILLLASITCFSILAFFSWLDGVITYGQRHLSLHSPGLNLLFDLAYRDDTVFFSLPQAGISLKLPYWRLARFGKRYWLPIKITLYNVLFLITALLTFRIIKNRGKLISRLRKFLQHPGSVKLLLISQALTIIIFLLSIFPTPSFNFWWRRYDFIPLIAKHPTHNVGTLALGLYDFMSNLLIFRGNRLFYASLFTIPHFILKWVGISCFLLFILGVLRLPSGIVARLDSWLDKLSRLNYKKWLIGACLWVFILANLISFITNQRLPAYTEDTAQSFQAQLIASGKVAEPINFSREFFWFPLLQLDSHWYSSLAPGQSLLLAIGHKLGVPWLINPLLGSLTVAILYILASKVYGSLTAILSILLMIFSPLYLSLSASYLNHLPFILCVLLGLLFYYHSLSTPGALYPSLSGLCWGLAALTRPLFAMMLVLPLMLYLILSRKSPFRLRLKLLLLSLAGLAIPLGLLAKYNQAVLGNPWGLAPGYSLGAWLTRGLRTPIEGLFYLMNNLGSLNEQLWGAHSVGSHFVAWGIPAFFLILIWVLSSSQLERWDYILLWGTICLLFINFLAYDTQNGLVNPLITLIPFLALLSARAIMSLPTALAQFGFPSQQIKSLLALGLVVCCAILLTTSIPPLLYKTNSHRLNLTNLVKKKEINTAIIFLEQEPYLATFAHNRPNLSNDLIFARHLKAYNRKLMQEFPGHSYYYYNQQDKKLVPLSP